jgi:hypothetical protein
MVAAARSRVQTRPSWDGRSHGKARVLGWAGLLAALLTPIALWHRAIWLIADDFRIELEYLVTGWTAYSLIAVGLLFFLPVVISIGRDPNSRLYPRSRNAYIGWGAVLYTLGMSLASQVAQIAQGPAGP